MSIPQGGKYLTFELSSQVYAIYIGDVKEILSGEQTVVPVPEFPDYGKGVINLRGDIVPIIDMRRRFRLPDAPPGIKSCTIVTEGCTGEVKYLGFSVDKVRTVTDFEEKDITPPPKITSAVGRFVKGVYKAEGKIVMILEPISLLTETMSDAIDTFVGGVSADQIGSADDGGDYGGPGSWL